ncbi:MAG TPA: Tol-Pal system beta propeller repeat protein TolB [Bdellovibrionota bacterium]|nr:Tol-Pal system beta propeller repeat protein TolB [Bdellovibrionota bacterium]
MRRGSVFAGFFVLLGLLPSPASAKIYIDITQVSDRSFPIAIVPPVRVRGDEDPNLMGEQFARKLRDDLELMGLFRFIEKGAFLEDPNKKGFAVPDIDFASWTVLDVLALTKGWYRVEGKRLTIELHLFDVLLRQELTAKRYEGTVSDVPKIAHKFANEIMRVLAGEEGVFDTRIAFIGKRAGHKELYAMDFNGDNLEQLTDDRSIVLSPAWDKDGRSIYYTSFKGGKTPQLWKYDLRRKDTSRVASMQGMVIGLSLSPVENILATTLTKDGNSEIYLLEMDGRTRDRLTNNREIDVSASFSPDGRTLVFVSTRDGSPQIYKMDRNGQNAQRLTYKGANNTTPVWSPRGDKILFAGMDTDGQVDVFSMNIDGSGMVRLTYDSRNNEEPSWSPNGQLITFTSNRKGSYQIYVMRPDGSKQIQLTNGSFDHLMPKWGPLNK